MSLKINVIYKGIIYRVKGIKVLCSVVWTVIILLFAIVGMGVWMIINVYENNGKDLSFFGTSLRNDTEKMISDAPSIDFDQSGDIVPSDISIYDMRIKSLDLIEVNENFKSTNPPVEEPDGAFVAVSNKRYEVPQTEFFSEDTEIKKLIPSVRIKEEDIIFMDSNTEKAPQMKEYKEIQKPSSRVILKELNVTPPSSPPSRKIQKSRENFEYSPFHDLHYPSMAPGKMNDHEIKLINVRNPTRRPITLTNQLLRRSGPTPTHTLTYVGPPVVGYGSNPYEKLTRERIREYDQFWETYTGKKPEFKFNINENTKANMRPHLRGLRPTGVEYDLPVRPDAQAPTKVKLRRKPNQRRKTEPLESISDSEQLSEDRFENQESHTTPRPSVPILTPLHDLYDYSKKLAASLLSFNSKSPDQIQDSSEKLAEYGINLIESHNHIFKQPTGGPLDRFASLIPSAERLKSLDPFELSLVTWTFLDYWEFLIEKVGSLSDEDLVMLQERLEKLRKRKDEAMTRVFVNETINRYSSGKQRSISLHGQMNKTKIQELTNAQTNDVNNVRSPVRNMPSLNTLITNEHILGGLFSNITTNNSKRENKYLGSDLPVKDLLIGIHSTNESVNGIKILETPLSTKLQNESSSVNINKIDGTHEPNPVFISSEFIEVVNPETSKENKLNDIKSETKQFLNETKITSDFDVLQDQKNKTFNLTMQKLTDLLISSQNSEEIQNTHENESLILVEEGRSAWDPFGLFTSASRMEFMQFAVKVVFNFGKVYLKKPYALDCTMLLFCKDLNQDSRKGGMESMAAKLKSVGLKVLTESEQELRESDTFADVWRSVTAWTPLQCDTMFPRCDGPKALEIVNEVALGSTSN